MLSRTQTALNKNRSQVQNITRARETAAAAAATEQQHQPSLFIVSTSVSNVFLADGTIIKVSTQQPATGRIDIRVIVRILQELVTRNNNCC